jgi:hypothetical protein
MPLGDILSVTTGRLVSRDHIGGVYKILDYMTGDSLFTHQLPRASSECRPALLAQHPQLGEIEVPEFEPGDAESIFSWLDEQEAIHGTHLDVDPLIIKVGDYSNPIGDLVQMTDKPIVVVEADQ